MFSHVLESNDVQGSQGSFTTRTSTLLEFHDLGCDLGVVFLDCIYFGDATKTHEWYRARTITGKTTVRYLWLELAITNRTGVHFTVSTTSHFDHNKHSVDMYEHGSNIQFSIDM